MSKITPLLRFLRALTVEQQKAFAEKCGTTRGYPYQLAGSPHPNPQLRLALAMCRESRSLARKVLTAPLTIDDLLIGIDDEKENV